LNPAYKRVYHFHVRKTAGTSLNAAFGALGGLTVREMSTNPEVTRNGLRFVANGELTKEGDFFFASSHDPAWRLCLPPDTFTVTILRDPLARVVSYYRYLLWARANPRARDIEPFIEQVCTESKFIDGGFRYCLGQLSPHSLRLERSAILALGPWQFLERLSPRRRESTFCEFLARVPPRHLLTQVHMFSKRLDPMEAAEGALACSAVCFTETFSEDLRRVAGMLELDLDEKRERQFGEKMALSDWELELLRKQLAPEYAMIKRVREGLATAPRG
jgi:hypothetical protein